jgi:DNA-binding NarL/FixJ family response regulator
MALTNHDWERINKWLLRLYAQREKDALAQAMMEAAMDLVPADSASIHHLEIANGQYRAEMSPASLWSEEQVQEVGRHLHQSPFPAYHLATGDARWKTTTDFMPLEDFKATELYRSLRWWNVEVQMCAMLGILDGVAHAISLQRSAGAFSERERELLDVLHPHFVTSFTNMMTLQGVVRSVEHLAGLLDHAPGAYGYLEKDGSVGWLQPKAVEWLREFFGSGQRPPREIRQIVKTLTAEGGEVGHLEQRGTEGTLFVCVTVSPMGGWMLRLDRTPRELPARVVPLPEFTARQNEVLRWMSEGKRNGEIATILSISSRTVEKHVEVILKTFGVENRATAIVRAMERHGLAALGSGPS